MWKADEAARIVIYFGEDGEELGYGTVETLDLYLKDLGSVGVDGLTDAHPSTRIRYKGFRFCWIPGSDRQVAIGKPIHHSFTENIDQWKGIMQGHINRLHDWGDDAGVAWLNQILDEGKLLGYVTMEMHAAVETFWDKRNKEDTE